MKREKMKPKYIEDKLSAETLNNSLEELREYEFKLPITDGPNSAIDVTNTRNNCGTMLKLTNRSSGEFRRISNIEEAEEIGKRAAQDLLDAFNIV